MVMSRNTTRVWTSLPIKETFHTVHEKYIRTDITGKLGSAESYSEAQGSDDGSISTDTKTSVSLNCNYYEK